MSLLSLQRRMARAVMTPLTPNERMRRLAPDGRPMRRVAAGFIKPNDRLTSFERLEIYNRQYWFRILSGFAEDFPGVRAVLGGRRFDALSKAYLQAVSFPLLHPSQSRLAPGILAARAPPLGRRPPKIGCRYGSPGMGRYRSL